MRQAEVFRKTTALILLSSAAAVALSGCGNAVKAAPSASASVVVSLTPTSASVMVSGSLQFYASVQNDNQNKGVTWALIQSGAACNPGCGTISGTASHAVYSAPTVTPRLTVVSVVATSVADGAESAASTITIIANSTPAVSLSIKPSSASVPISVSQQFSATVTNDPENAGVSWSLTQSGAPCSPGCGSITGSTPQTAIYLAPATAPSPNAVLIAATSLANGTQSASATITISTPAQQAAPPTPSDAWVDITNYGARSVTTAPTATATCIAGSANVQLADNGWPQDFTQFQNNDSIRLDNCGGPTAMTPPTGVSVSPGMNAGGSLAVSGLTMGNTSYSYQVIACDKTGGCSSASAPATTGSGAATLGRVTATIVQMSLSQKTMTVTTAAPHGFAKYALIHIDYFSTKTAAFEGSYIVSGVPSPTTFTFLTSLDSRIPGTPTFDTSGGTVGGFNCNVVSWNAEPNAWKYFIYGRGAGAPTSLGVADPGITTWQDYGSPMMDSMAFPSFVPPAPPTNSSNQYLLATISNGGGSNAIQVSAPAQNTIANVSARMGSDAAILAAFQAAQYGTLLIPKGNFQVAGYLDLHAFVATFVVQGGTLQVADTLQIPGGLSAPLQPTALSSGDGQNGEETTEIVLTGGGHKTVISGTFTADHTLTVPDVSGSIAVRIANGTVAMPSDPVDPGSCGAIVTAAANSVLQTDTVSFSSSAAPMPGPTPKIHTWPTANNVNFQYCNETAASLTPQALILNWQVLR